MLHLLVKYAVDNGLVVEPGFKPKDVRWAITCDEKGQFLGVVELGNTDQKKNPGQTFNKCPDTSFAEMKAGGIKKSHFLVETADVVVLLGKGNDDNKIRDKHIYFIELFKKASSEIPELASCVTILSDKNILAQIRKQLEEKRAKPTDKVTLMIGHAYPVESEVCHSWWREYRKTIIINEDKNNSKQNSDNLMRCLITGELAIPMATLPKIEKLSDVGGLAMGDAFSSFKQESFCSYDLVQSANAAVSEKAAYAYRAGLNHLIKKSGVKLAGAKVIHWFKEAILPDDDPLPWLIATDEQQELSARRRANDLLKAIKCGNRPDLRNNYYYALTLSGASGRVMVRDWMEGQFEKLVENINAWFIDLSIVDRDGKSLSRPPKFMAVLGATVRDLNDLPAPLVAKMWHVALNNEPIPLTMLSNALKRAKVDIINDSPASSTRMGLLKAYHVRKDKMEGTEPMIGPFLNENHPEPAYHCGRLMAVLADLQRAAQGNVGAGVVQRYFSSASTTPALVLGRLTNLSQHHLNKLEPGLAYWYEKRIACIWGCIKDNAPATLTLEQQSLFALGYYQQMAAPKKTEKDNQEKESTNE